MTGARKWVADVGQEIFIGGYKLLSNRVEIERFFVHKVKCGFSYGQSRHSSTLSFTSPSSDVPEHVHPTPEEAFKYFVRKRIKSLMASIEDHEESIRKDEAEISKLSALKFEDVPIKKTDPGYESVDW